MQGQHLRAGAAVRRGGMQCGAARRRPAAGVALGAGVWRAAAGQLAALQRPAGAALQPAVAAAPRPHQKKPQQRATAPPPRMAPKLQITSHSRRVGGPGSGVVGPLAAVTLAQARSQCAVAGLVPGRAAWAAQALVWAAAGAAATTPAATQAVAHKPSSFFSSGVMGRKPPPGTSAIGLQRRGRSGVEARARRGQGVGEAWARRGGAQLGHRGQPSHAQRTTAGPPCSCGMPGLAGAPHPFLPSGPAAYAISVPASGSMQQQRSQAGRVVRQRQAAVLRQGCRQARASPSLSFLITLGGLQGRRRGAGEVKSVVARLFFWGGGGGGTPAHQRERRGNRVAAGSTDSIQATTRRF